MVEFKKELTEKIKVTYETAKEPNYKSFVKTFGITKVAMIKTKEVQHGEYIIEQLTQIRAELQEFRRMAGSPCIGSSPPVVVVSADFARRSRSPKQ